MCTVEPPHDVHMQCSVPVLLVNAKQWREMMSRVQESCQRLPFSNVHILPLTLFLFSRRQALVRRVVMS